MLNYSYAYNLSAIRPIYSNHLTHTRSKCCVSCGFVYDETIKEKGSRLIDSQS